MLATDFNKLQVIGLVVVLLSGIQPAFADGSDAPQEKGAAAPAAETTTIFTGGDVSPHSYYLYTGGILALNGDSSRDGFRVRAFTGGANYKYDTPSVPGGRVEGESLQFDAMLGYSFIRPMFVLTAMGGVDIEQIHLAPRDPSAVLIGSKTGIRGLAELTTGAEVPFYGNLSGTYSTAWDSYWSRGRLGYRFGRVLVGAEGSLLGNEKYHAQQVGGFTTITTKLLGRNVDLEFSVGHQFVSDSNSVSSNGSGTGISNPSAFGGGEGTYAAAGLSVSF